MKPKRCFISTPCPAAGRCEHAHVREWKEIFTPSNIYPYCPQFKPLFVDPEHEAWGEGKDGEE